MTTMKETLELEREAHAKEKAKKKLRARNALLVMVASLYKCAAASDLIVAGERAIPITESSLQILVKLTQEL